MGHILTAIGSMTYKSVHDNKIISLEMYYFVFVLVLYVF